MKNAVPQSEITLPRPNPGPELLPPSQTSWLSWLVLAVSLALLGIVVFRRWKRRLRPKSVPQADPAPNASTSQSLDERLRLLLVDRFGPSWATYTTEEIASSSVLSDRYGEEAFARLVDYWRQVDRRKFSGGEATIDEDALAWTAHFVDFIESEARPMSMINGK